ncbi:hypothetical protein SAMN04487911_11144 [Arenibacter nanhaiticus]|uniref:Uncharacterized protein n=1 Tax=Arenibacter nanhaiticus TaxID=558155 RepID=A0A1M6GK77_9FLAO|nr:hypothetical protein [Arenibacter nanhaiticus]SHJ10321.1 hypothetical protein SAMN04487911_11144 [Arenibacter nanhaiticus]
MQGIISDSFWWSPEKEIIMTVLRGEQELVLKAMAKIPIVTLEVLAPIENATAQQVKLREYWLKN